MPADYVGYSDFVGCDGPSLSWSPNGRFVALTSSATQDCDDRFEVIDATSGRRIIAGRWEKGSGEGGTVWAPDSKSVYGTSLRVSSTRTALRGIDRFSLTGRRTNVVKYGPGWFVPDVALRSGLVYHAATATGRSAVYLHGFATGRSTRLFSPSPVGSIWAVVPLERVP